MVMLSVVPDTVIMTYCHVNGFPNAASPALLMVGTAWVRSLRRTTQRTSCCCHPLTGCPVPARLCRAGGLAAAGPAVLQLGRGGAGGHRDLHRVLLPADYLEQVGGRGQNTRCDSHMPESDLGRLGQTHELGAVS